MVPGQTGQVGDDGGVGVRVVDAGGVGVREAGPGLASVGGHLHEPEVPLRLYVPVGVQGEHVLAVLGGTGKIYLLGQQEVDLVYARPGIPHLGRHVGGGRYVIRVLPAGPDVVVPIEHELLHRYVVHWVVWRQREIILELHVVVVGSIRLHVIGVVEVLVREAIEIGVQVSFLIAVEGVSSGHIQAVDVRHIIIVQIFQGYQLRIIAVQWVIAVHVGEGEQIGQAPVTEHLVERQAVVSHAQQGVVHAIDALKFAVEYGLHHLGSAIVVVEVQIEQGHSAIVAQYQVRPDARHVSPDRQGVVRVGDEPGDMSVRNSIAADDLGHHG
ncbi:MAG: hypothetical protein A4E30_01264 [Methanomassiliicoccales archaeon PtaB.Bin215]|nr:MAG: hypothetical protein A4E30_01264 [Methanomassiliicoccales archaeon PtaB.Bin215]